MADKKNEELEVSVLAEDVEVKEEEEIKEKLMEKDVYATAEEAEVRAEEMGGKGSHEMKIEIEEKEEVRYMPFPTHDEYEQALSEETEEKEEVVVESSQKTLNELGMETNTKLKT